MRTTSPNLSPTLVGTLGDDAPIPQAGHFLSDASPHTGVCDLMRWSARKPTLEEIYWYEVQKLLVRATFHLLSTCRTARARQFLKISRLQAPPKLDPSDPAKLLWDWSADEAPE